MECAICFGQSNLITYKHDSICFGFIVHDSCLMNWFCRNNFECPICRKRIFTEDRLLNSTYTYNQLYLSDVENQIYIPRYNFERTTSEIENICNMKRILIWLIAMFILSIIITIIASSV